MLERLRNCDFSVENLTALSKMSMGSKMGLVIPDEILQAARVSASDLKREIAVLLFQKEKLT